MSDGIGTGGYFSIDGGVTNLRNFAGGNDWDLTAPDSFDADGFLSDELPITPLDITAMSVLGWDPAPAATPLPSSISLFVFGLASMLGLGRFSRRPT